MKSLKLFHQVKKLGLLRGPSNAFARSFSKDENSRMSFIKDENTGMKYWESDFKERQALDQSDDDENDIKTNYEDMYKNSYDRFSQQADLNSPDHLYSLSHIDSTGKANMVDVGDKKITQRTARAVASIDIGRAAYKLVVEYGLKKGDVLSVAQIAGILGAKKTSDLIPLCHPVGLTKVDVNCTLSNDGSYAVNIECVAKCVSRTGVEMEALMGASIAALTIYDMCKAVNKHMVIGNIKVVEKLGGRNDFKSD